MRVIVRTYIVEFQLGKRSVISEIMMKLMVNIIPKILKDIKVPNRLDFLSLP